MLACFGVKVSFLPDRSSSCWTQSILLWKHALKVRRISRISHDGWGNEQSIFFAAGIFLRHIMSNSTSFCGVLAKLKRI
jgi:hypothetical protein